VKNYTYKIKKWCKATFYIQINEHFMNKLYQNCARSDNWFINPNEIILIFLKNIKLFFKKDSTFFILFFLQPD